MSKFHRETYDLTMDVAHIALSLMDTFYDAHPNPQNGDSVAFYFELFTAEFVKGWKDREYKRHPYDYNRQMVNHSDKSSRTLRGIYNN